MMLQRIHLQVVIETPARLRAAGNGISERIEPVSGVPASIIMPIIAAGEPWVHASCRSTSLASVQPDVSHVAAVCDFTETRSETDVEQASQLHAFTKEAAVARMMIQ